MMLSLPFEPRLWGIPINIHLILEYMAFFVGYRYYAYLRKNTSDPISSSNRLSIILGAALGALIGSRIFGYFENPVAISFESLPVLLNVKTIMGGLFGGLIGVELMKKLIGESSSSGDLFTLPIILGIFIGRIGCFLSGTNEFTYGKATTFFTGMDLGDGVIRHPLALYEMVFLMGLFLIFRRQSAKASLRPGLTFQYFMISYFGFRFCMEFLKPNIFFILGFSSIQWLCVLCWLYYYKTISKLLTHAYQKIYLL